MPPVATCVTGFLKEAPKYTAMSELPIETKPAPRFNPETFAMNLAHAMENSGRALAAYLKPRENAEARDKPPNEIAELVKTFSAVAEYWLSDQTRAAELQAKLGKAYLDLMLGYPQLQDLLCWGMCDRYSWLDGFDPRADKTLKRGTPYDVNFRPKPLRASIASAFAHASSRHA